MSSGGHCPPVSVSGSGVPAGILVLSPPSAGLNRGTKARPRRKPRELRPRVLCGYVDRPKTVGPKGVTLFQVTVPGIRSAITPCCPSPVLTCPCNGVVHISVNTPSPSLTLSSARSAVLRQAFRHGSALAHGLRLGRSDLAPHGRRSRLTRPGTRDRGGLRAARTVR